MDQPTPAERQQWLEEFEAAARRPLELRMKDAFIKTYKPVLDDAPFSRIRHDGRLPRLVRGQPSGMARMREINGCFRIGRHLSRQGLIFFAFRDLWPFLFAAGYLVSSALLRTGR
jgi:hypothetical protein